MGWVGDLGSAAKFARFRPTPTTVIPADAGIQYPVR